MLRNSLLVLLSSAASFFIMPASSQQIGMMTRGQDVFKAANCVGCHKWSGVGGGGYGAGGAASLRETHLDDEQIVETVRCGRPGTGMPYFDKNAYAEGACYGGVKLSQIKPSLAPLPGPRFLSLDEIQAVAAYVIHHFKGKGEPTFEECQSFFGTSTRLCDSFPRISKTTKGSSQAGSSLESIHKLNIEIAPDANAVGTKP